MMIITGRRGFEIRALENGQVFEQGNDADHDDDDLDNLLDAGFDRQSLHEVRARARSPER